MEIDNKLDIIIVGAGACGLMAARELGKAGMNVLILEARDRTGGRIMSLSESDFGYPAEGGAEWIHGLAPITKTLVKEAGLTLIPEAGEIWSTRNGELSLHKSFIQNNDTLKTKLAALKKDISIADFLELNFTNDGDKEFKNSILKMVEGYDAADPKQISTFTLRDEWLSKSAMSEIVDDHRIREGYGALISFLESECRKYQVEIRLDAEVKEIDWASDISVITKDETFSASKVILTVPTPVIKDIHFKPEIKDKLDSASRIGFGNVIKLLIKFKSRWWENIPGKNLSKMAFIICNEKFLTWWAQYPEINTVLTGWMAGPEAAKYKDASSEELLDIALTSLSNVLKFDKDFISKEILLSKVINWSADPFTQGAYSYTTINTKDAYEQLVTPINDKIYFAGEALFPGHATATVEGAFGSGLNVAKQILNS